MSAQNCCVFAKVFKIFFKDLCARSLQDPYQHFVQHLPLKSPTESEKEFSQTFRHIHVSLLYPITKMCTTPQLAPLHMLLLRSRLLEKTDLSRRCAGACDSRAPGCRHPPVQLQEPLVAMALPMASRTGDINGANGKSHNKLDDSPMSKTATTIFTSQWRQWLLQVLGNSNMK